MNEGDVPAEGTQGTAESASLRDEHAPAYYASGTTGWRAWWTLLHPPYTLMHLSFVVVGAALAPDLHGDRLGWTVLAFFLGMGLAAHALDEFNGRPLATRIPAWGLLVLAVGALLAAAGLGAWGAWYYDLGWGLLFVPVGVVLVVGYNMELFGGRLHSDLAFVLAWGSFPVVVAYFAQTGRLDPVVVLGAVYAGLASALQRVLSTPARFLRRRVRHVMGTLVHKDGTTRAITRGDLLAPQERALRLLVAGSLGVAGMLVWVRLGGS